MNWRIRLGAWLLKAVAVKKNYNASEVLIFADWQVLDFIELNKLQEQSPSSVPIQFIPVRSLHGVPISHSMFVVNVPKI